MLCVFFAIEFTFPCHGYLNFRPLWFLAIESLSLCKHRNELHQEPVRITTLLSFPNFNVSVLQAIFL